MGKSIFQKAEITVWGLRSLDRALKDLAPDLRRELYKEVGSVVSLVAEQARTNTRGLSALGQNSGIGRSADAIANAIKVRRGAKTRRARATAFGFRIEQTHGWGVMAETARIGHTISGKALVDVLDRKVPAPGGRLMWKAMDAKRDQVDKTVKTAVHRIEQELQTRVDAMTTGTP